MKNVGIKDKVKTYQMIIIAVFGVLCTLTIVFWILCWSDYNNNKFINGIEVEAGNC